MGSQGIISSVQLADQKGATGKDQEGKYSEGKGKEVSAEENQAQFRQKNYLSMQEGCRRKKDKA